VLTVKVREARDFFFQNAQLPQGTRTLGLGFNPIQKILERDFLDGALVGDVSFKPQ
jgi:hypothetical protein